MPPRDIHAGSEDLITVIRDIRSLFLFKKKMGRGCYPSGEEIKRLLDQVSERVFDKPQPAGEAPSPPAPSHATEQNKPSCSTLLSELNKAIGSCTSCSLASNRMGIVTGTGSTRIRLMVVGDFSCQKRGFSSEILFGEQEDIMLWNMMKAIGLDRKDVFVSNCVKCCPTVSGPVPDRAGEQSCFPFLEQEIAILRPQIICAMGETATRLLVGDNEPFIRLRGKFHPFRTHLHLQVRIMATYHPRFLLQHPAMKKATWLDLQSIQKQLAR